ncbi:MAG: ribosome maturation factor RimM [Peptococcaceae bacterium]|nr:ribosome maturation factor RimM [Peptococcaceae bacterium]
MAERIAIGKIVSIHGVKGEVRVLPWTDDPERRFSKLGEVAASKDGITRMLHITSAREHKKLVILGFKEVMDADGALKLRDFLLEVEKKDLLPLEEGHFYIFDLIGLRVITLAGIELGMLTEVLQTGANDVYVVKTADGKEVLLPALKSVIKHVDLNKREILVDPLPGLLD